jgi:hypothetical protein
MTIARANLDALLGALSTIERTASGPSGQLGNALFVGSGDSLSACLLAQSAGHHAASAGDIAWTRSVPPRIDTVVGVSHSGRTTATIEALKVAREHRLRTIAITVNQGTAITTAADEVITADDIHLTETIPAAGFLSLAVAVLSLLEADTTSAFRAVGTTMSALADNASKMAASLPRTMPAAISVLTLPDMRAAGDFWSLKLIEATGLTVRSAALEESGHVDYFIGPQPHLSLHLIGKHGAARHTRLAAALTVNGHTALSLRAAAIVADSERWQLELATAALGAYVAEEAADTWKRPPFRNHSVPMDARHIQIID